MASLWFEELGDQRYKVRWREQITVAEGESDRGADGRLRRRLRSQTVEGKDARDALMNKVRRALVEEGEYQAPTAADNTVANLETAAKGWLRWKTTRCTPSTVNRYKQEMARFFEAIRKVKSWSKDRVIPVSVLTRELLIEVTAGWQAEGLSESFVYSCSRSALELWRWAHDDRGTFPGIPVPPQVSTAVLPRPPAYTAPPAPQLAEADACLRHLPHDAVQSRRIGTFLRYTGLRIFQVVSLRRKDLDLVNATLTVTTGKSRAEKAEMRTIPVSKSLIAEVRDWVEGLELEHLLFPAWGIVGSERRASIRPEMFKEAWKEATKWGEAREIAWKPVNRMTARPEHAFRAAFQAALRDVDVTEEAIDMLVGHHGRTTRARHYAGADTLWRKMVEGVNRVPPIDWTGPVDKGTVISLAKRRKGPAS